MRDVVSWAEGEGWTADLTGGMHIVFLRPGCRKIFAAFTGGPRSALYAKSALRRCLRTGLDREARLGCPLNVDPVGGSGRCVGAAASP